MILPALAEGLCPAEMRGEVPGTVEEPDGVTQVLETAVLAASDVIQATAAGARVGTRKSKKATSKVVPTSKRTR